MSDWIAAAFLVAGGFFCLVAGVGVLRFRDTYQRMHASTKAGTLGLCLVCIAAMIEAETWGNVARPRFVFLFMIATAPVGVAPDRSRRLPLPHPRGARHAARPRLRDLPQALLSAPHSSRSGCSRTIPSHIGWHWNQPVNGVPFTAAAARAFAGSISSGLPTDSTRNCAWQARSIATNHHTAASTVSPTVISP